MKEGKELYKKAEIPEGAYLAPCPVCGADAELWQYSKDFKNGPIDKVVMCANGERFGPQDGAVNEGCLLYMPPQDFYRGRVVEAVKFWNQYAKALNAQRRGRNWKRAQVLREATPNGISPSTGMSLRDYFAAAAMQGWLASLGEESRHPADTSFGAQALAQQSYAIADAMMDQRDEQ